MHAEVIAEVSTQACEQAEPAELIGVQAPVCAIAHAAAPTCALTAAPQEAAPCEPPQALQGPIHEGPATSPPAPPRHGTQVASPSKARPSRRTPVQDDEEGQVGWVTCSPERPVMEILFRCLEAGRRYYAVRLNGQEIFVGTRHECDRFLEIHNEKVALEQAEARKTPRGRPAALHIYRTARA